MRFRGNHNGVRRTFHKVRKARHTDCLLYTSELVQRLAKEYNLPSIDRMDSSKDYRFTYIGYDGPKRTAEEKEASFIKRCV